MIHPKPLRRVMAATLLLAWAAGSAQAGCTISSTGLAFGAYQPLTFAGKLTSAAVVSTATVSVVCTGITGGGAYTIALGPSTTGSGDRISTRYLAHLNGGAPMAFNVYTDTNHSSVWGNTTGALLSGSIATGDSNLSHTVYGRIPAGQNTLKAGSYSDSLTMTITYNP